ncbi:aldo/keto reductase [Oceanibium sediminis]|uniref:aldo/keto reductase n=1 Tax=Oceanibium sediminis TaxID=2026339 RepID=UPI00280C0699|nr:aldo/keto reductase [Oceanibium sediminis]
MIPQRPLGRTGLTVPQICLGSMTWGSQNTEAEAHAQMDMAMDRGVTFFDTAEGYPTPMRPETQGRTEEYIGTWFAASGRRADVTLATKITGARTAHIRDGSPITGAAIRAAVDASLRRLQTDYIDLYQLHWPNRAHYHFRRNWTFDPTGADTATEQANILETLETLDELVKAGKIRAIGLSNDTAWGTMQFLNMAEAHGLPRIASIQNEYSLMCRLFDTDLAEIAHHEDVGLLAYSPQAAGMLSGKYSGGARPAGSRGAINPPIGGRLSPHSEMVADEYVALAHQYGLNPVQMAIAFCLTRPFMTSAIIGATSIEQLETVLGSVDIALPPEVMEDIDALHRKYPMPY